MDIMGALRLIKLSGRMANSLRHGMVKPDNMNRDEARCYKLKRNTTTHNETNCGTASPNMIRQNSLRQDKIILNTSYCDIARFNTASRDWSALGMARSSMTRQF